MSLPVGNLAGLLIRGSRASSMPALAHPKSTRLPEVALTVRDRRSGDDSVATTPAGGTGAKLLSRGYHQ